MKIIRGHSWRTVLASLGLVVGVLSIFESSPRLFRTVAVRADEQTDTSNPHQRRRLSSAKDPPTLSKAIDSSKPIVTIISSHPDSTSTVEDPIAKKQRQDLEYQVYLSKKDLQKSSNITRQAHQEEIPQVVYQTVILTLDEQRAFLDQHGTHDCQIGDTISNENAVLQKFDDLLQRQQSHYATELWKYCALHVYSRNHGGAVYVDSDSPLLTNLHTILRPAIQGHNLAVLSNSYFPKTIHGSFFYARGATSTSKPSTVPLHMLQVLVTTPTAVLETSPLLLPRTLYALIATSISKQDSSIVSLRPGQNGDEWYLMEQTCMINPLIRHATGTSLYPEREPWTDSNSYRLALHCPRQSGFCCSVTMNDPSDLDSKASGHQRTVMLNRHPLLPYQVIPPPVPMAEHALDSNQHAEFVLQRPYNAQVGHYDEDELPYISHVDEEVYTRPDDYPPTPNFYDILMSNDCLPGSEECSKCLRAKSSSATCTTCADACPCYCKTLCQPDTVDAKFVAKQLIVSPPKYSRDPNRLIPRIIHQTWFETLTKEKYPNMSRLVESFKQSGWEYKFYSDEEAANFLSTHFPSQVREAYDALRPGAFKADLFRYCALLIHGGVYADVDIMLESSLDFSIAPDVGFMVPIDEPGIPIHRRMCLWNGFIAAAPGHPFLAKAIETVVNQIRNRFTSVDTDATFCPNPELSILHAFDTLFTAGPCILGASINRSLGRHGQTAFEPGEIHQWTGEQRQRTLTGTSFVVGADDHVSSRVPGRTIILNQNKWDMGSHRFTWEERNLVVAATDLPDSNDRENSKKEDKDEGSGGGEHYSKTHAVHGVYGVEGLYVDRISANEDIKIVIDVSRIPPVEIPSSATH